MIDRNTLWVTDGRLCRLCFVRWLEFWHNEWRECVGHTILHTHFWVPTILKGRAECLVLSAVVHLTLLRSSDPPPIAITGWGALQFYGEGSYKAKTPLDLLLVL